MGASIKQITGDNKMTINFKVPEIKELQPRLLVMGIGGAGGNAINEMIDNGMQGVEFIAVNTDAQDSKHCNAKSKIPWFLLVRVKHSKFGSQQYLKNLRSMQEKKLI